MYYEYQVCFTSAQGDRNILKVYKTDEEAFAFSEGYNIWAPTAGESYVIVVSFEE